MPPRGGRGGAGAGRARPAAGKVRIGGIDIEVDEETQNTARDRPQPSQTFPPFQVSTARPLTETERIEIARYRFIRDRIHKGPLYTTFADEPPIRTQGQKRKAGEDKFDAFNGMETYSMRYTTRKRKIPPLSSRPFVLHFFPSELHSTLDPSSATSHANGPVKKKQLQTDFDIDELEADPTAEGKDPDEDEAVAKNAQEDGEDPPDEDIDDDYDEDDDDEGDDYNAEQYFDDGEREEDMGDADEGGGDDY